MSTQKEVTGYLEGIGLPPSLSSFYATQILHSLEQAREPGAVRRAKDSIARANRTQLGKLLYLMSELELSGQLEAHILVCVAHYLDEHQHAELAA